MKKIFMRILVLLSAVLCHADVTDAGLNIENGETELNQNVNSNRFTKDKNPSTYNFKMDH